MDQSQVKSESIGWSSNRRSTRSQTKRNSSLVVIDNNGMTQLDTNIMNSLVEESDESYNRLEKMNQNNPLMVYENRMFCIEKKSQLKYLKKTIFRIKNDRNGRLKNDLKMKAMETFNSPILQSGSHVIPIVKFDINGEPNFEFYFGSANLPTDPIDMLHIDREIIYFSKLIYDCIQMPYNYR